MVCVFFRSFVLPQVCVWNKLKSDDRIGIGTEQNKIDGM